MKRDNIAKYLSRIEDAENVLKYVFRFDLDEILDMYRNQPVPSNLIEDLYNKINDPNKGLLSKMKEYLFAGRPYLNCLFMSTQNNPSDRVAEERTKSFLRDLYDDTIGDYYIYLRDAIGAEKYDTSYTALSKSLVLYDGGKTKIKGFDFQSDTNDNNSIHDLEEVKANNQEFCDPDETKDYLRKTNFTAAKRAVEIENILNEIGLDSPLGRTIKDSSNCSNSDDQVEEQNERLKFESYCTSSDLFQFFIIGDSHSYIRKLLKKYVLWKQEFLSGENTVEKDDVNLFLDSWAFLKQELNNNRFLNESDKFYILSKFEQIFGFSSSIYLFCKIHGVIDKLDKINANFFLAPDYFLSQSRINLLSTYDCIPGLNARNHILDEAFRSFPVYSESDFSIINCYDSLVTLAENPNEIASKIPLCAENSIYDNCGRWFRIYSLSTHYMSIFAAPLYRTIVMVLLHKIIWRSTFESNSSDLANLDDSIGSTSDVTNSFVSNLYGILRSYLNNSFQFDHYLEFHDTVMDLLKNEKPSSYIFKLFKRNILCYANNRKNTYRGPLDLEHVDAIFESYIDIDVPAYPTYLSYLVCHHINEKAKLQSNSG